jgi:hypothetical protein
MKDLHTFHIAATALIVEHLGRKWKFKWHNGLCSLGLCDYETKTISMSKPMALEIPRKECLDTLAHEIAHALCPHENHGEGWKDIARRLGARTKDDGWTEKLEKVSKRLQKRRNAKKRSKS